MSPFLPQACRGETASYKYSKLFHSVAWVKCINNDTGWLLNGNEKRFIEAQRRVAAGRSRHKSYGGIQYGPYFPTWCPQWIFVFITIGLVGKKYTKTIGHMPRLHQYHQSPFIGPKKKQIYLGPHWNPYWKMFENGKSSKEGLKSHWMSNIMPYLESEWKKYYKMTCNTVRV